MNEKRLFDLREYKDLSQIKLADYLGITQQTYSLWEKGTKIIPLKHLNSLSNFYEISMDYIVGLTDEKNNSSIIKLTELNKNEIGSRIKKIIEDNLITIENGVFRHDTLKLGYLLFSEVLRLKKNKRKKKY